MSRQPTCPSCKGYNIRVVDRCCNYSAFSGYRYTPSDYSGVRCQECGNYWRTNAAYVERIKDE